MRRFIENGHNGVGICVERDMLTHQTTWNRRFSWQRRFAWLTIMLIAVMPIEGAGQASPVASPAATPIGEDRSDWWQGAPCYEIFVRSFADSDGDGIGDFAGVTDRLDYLNDGDAGTTDDLAVTCIWLMPIMESVSYHGYDVTDYYAVEQDYGTKVEFLTMIDAAHERGIKVIIDHVINHTSAEHPWFVDAASGPTAEHRDWYIFEEQKPSYTGPWGAVAWHPAPARSDFYYGVFWSGMPDLNYRNPEVTAEIYAITEFWLREMRVDGFRLDAIKHLIEDGQVQESTPDTLAWIQNYATFIRSITPDAYTVGEVAGANAAALEPYYPDILDQYFQFEIAAGTLTTASSGSPLLLGITVRGTEQAIPDQRYATFLTNHDQPRVATQLRGNQDQMRVAAMMLLSLPGTPFIYYGEEIGMSGDKPDELIRTPMQWSGNANGGFSTGTPWEPLQADWETVNVVEQQGVEDSLLETYQTWIRLRTEHPALSRGSFTKLETNNRAVFAFLRQTDRETVVVLINAGEGAVSNLSVTLPAASGGSNDDSFQNLIGTNQRARFGADGVLMVPELSAASGTVLLQMER